MISIQESFLHLRLWEAGRLGEAHPACLCAMPVAYHQHVSQTFSQPSISLCDVAMPALPAAHLYISTTSIIILYVVFEEENIFEKKMGKHAFFWFMVGVVTILLFFYHTVYTHSRAVPLPYTYLPNLPILLPPYIMPTYPAHDSTMPFPYHHNTIPFHHMAYFSLLDPILYLGSATGSLLCPHMVIPCRVCCCYYPGPCLLFLPIPFLLPPYLPFCGFVGQVQHFGLLCCNSLPFTMPCLRTILPIFSLPCWGRLGEQWKELGQTMEAGPLYIQWGSM